MKQGLGLIIGLIVGAVGAVLFSGSLAPDEGSPEERLEIAEIALGKARRTIRSLEADGRGGSRRTVSDGVRGIAQDIKEGRDVSMDDVFSTMKPWLRDMSPLFNRMREVNEEDWADNMTGEWARKYDLSSSERDQLKEWFQERSREKGEAFNAVVESETSGFVDYVRATEYDWQDADGIDSVMEGFLEGEELTQFREERFSERVASVQGEANRNLTRLDDIVGLDASQQDKVFGIMARGSGDYQEGMDFDGMGGATNTLDVRARDNAIRNVLSADQVRVFDAHQVERREEAEKDMRRMGMTLPKDWDLMEGRTF